MIVSLLTLCLGGVVILLTGGNSESKVESSHVDLGERGGFRGRDTERRGSTILSYHHVPRLQRIISGVSKPVAKSPKDYGFMVNLPLEYRGAEVVAGEEVLYDDGTTELRGVMDVGLGQEKILVIEKFGHGGSNRYSAVFSGEKLNVYVHPEHLGSIKYSLSLLGVDVLENRYGATVLSLALGEGGGEDFFRIKSMVEYLVQNRGEVFLVTASGAGGEGVYYSPDGQTLTNSR